MNYYKFRTTLIHLNERSLALAPVNYKNVSVSKRNKLLRTFLAYKPKDKNIFLIGSREIKF